MLKRKATASLSYKIFKRWSSCGGGGSGKKGVVFGCYDGCNPGDFKLSKAAALFDSGQSGKLSELLKGTGVPLGQAQVFSNLGDDFAAVAVAGVGPEGAGYDPLERLDVCKENIRIAAGVGAKKLQDQGINQILVEGFTSPEPAAEGASLAVWKYQDLKNPEKRQPLATLLHYEPGAGNADKEEWEKGVCKAEAQNLARYIEEVPANLMTPTIFAENAIEAVCPCGAQVEVHDLDWIETNKMGAFAALGKTSCEPPMFLELKYCGGAIEDEPVVFVGKGITYDTGGLCPKPCDEMSEYRGDLAGGAVILGTIRCIARMALPINVIGLIPLCEHMFGGYATKPGDIVIPSNGKSIRIVDPNNEGSVLLSDALIYTRRHKPCAVVSIASLTLGMRSTVGTAASGTFTTSNEMWFELDRAGGETGDRFWRFPNFWKTYTRRVTEVTGADICNVGKGSGNSCLQAAFLKEFIHEVDFAHIDIGGTGMLASGIGHPYLAAGVMSGRPTRSIVQFLYQIACPHTKGDDC
ncbi:unnamed protein product [Nezara viridula]|uniref:Cytosol aminopeptidase n=1 Tax=Nezara viridula TaxID=85310 RepID=A0A9P0HDR5_NEZVI|nr:unnamed protein product [Nezara viridula]